MAVRRPPATCCIEAPLRVPAANDWNDRSTSLAPPVLPLACLVLVGLPPAPARLRSAAAPGSVSPTLTAHGEDALPRPTLLTLDALLTELHASTPRRQRAAVHPLRRDWSEELATVIGVSVPTVGPRELRCPRLAG